MSVKQKVLIVDDEQDILNTIQRYLNRKKIVDVTVCTSPLNAIELVKSENFSLVLTDIMMPEIDGIEVLRRVKEINPELKVIMMTAYSSMDTILTCDQLGATDYVTKPFISLKDVEGKILDNLGL